jgi:predicted ATP-grasp superfamily ATP-dependent carboligase
MSMFNLAREHGLPAPVTLLPRSYAEAEQMAPTLNFPVMIKAVFGNRMQARSGRKMQRVDDRAELLRVYKELEDPEFPNIMLQELIPGDDTLVWIFNGYFDAHSDCRFPFTGRKLRQHPIHVGCASYGLCTWNEQVAGMTQRFMKTIGYRGILDIGYRYDARTDTYKVLDINPRVGQAFRLFVDDCGIDVVRCLYLDQTGQAQPSGYQHPRDRTWMIENFDLTSSFHYYQEGSLNVGQWLKTVWRTDEFAWLDKTDLAPALPVYSSMMAHPFSYIARRMMGGKRR